MQELLIRGKVVKGKGRGKTLGFPTINFSLEENPEVEHGVYAGIVKFGEKKYPAAIHYGPKPVFDEKDITLEAYILSEISVVPETGEVYLTERIRDIKNFPSQAELISQIEEDVRRIKKIFTEKSEFVLESE